MEPPPKVRILDEHGQPLSPRIEAALLSLIPKFQRHFPIFRDDVALIEVLEEAGRKIDHREQSGGRIERLHAYAWVTLRSVATSRLRRSAGRLAQRTLASAESEMALRVVPARIGTPDEIEQTILLRELLVRMSPDERLVCMWKKAGFSSQDIAARRGGTAAAVDKVLSRIRRKVRRFMGISDTSPPGGTGGESFNG